MTASLAVMMLLGALVAFALFAFMFTLTSPGGDEQRLSEVLKDPWATLGCSWARWSRSPCSRSCSP